MSNMLASALSDDFIWSAINSALSSTRRGSHGATMINCPMCVTRGESADKRYRCGISRRPDGVVIHCFNCAFATEYKLGEGFSKNLRNFLQRIGIPSMEVQRLKYKADQYRRMLTGNIAAQSVIPTAFRPTFQPAELPPYSFTIKQWADNDLEDEDFFAVAEYLFSRGDALADPTQFYWSPETEYDINRRLLIPFYYDGQLVGWTGRLVGPASAKRPKYHNGVQPPNYLYNNEVMALKRRFLILVEGPLDAKAVDGVATLGAKLSTEQAQWLNTCGHQIIVLADRDSSGQRMIDHALTNNWMVAFPRLKEGHGFQNWWEPDCKDAAEASKRYGKLYTIRSVVATATAQKIEINIKRNMLY